MKTTLKNAGSLGLITDIEAHNIPPEGVSAGNHFRCKHGYITPHNGYETYHDISATGEAQYLVPLQDAADYYWIFPLDNDADGVCEKIYSSDGTTLRNITRQTAAVDVDYTGSGQWNGCNIQDAVVLNNGTDNPQVITAGDVDATDMTWDGTNDWDDYDGLGSSYQAKVIRAHKNFLFALNITDNATPLPTTIHWSHPIAVGDAITAWNWDFSDATKLSNRRALGETQGEVVDGLTLRDSFVIYKEDAVYIAVYTNEPDFVFATRPLFVDRGIYAQDCMCDIGGRHFVVGDGKVYIHDGNTPKDILYGANASLLFDSIDQDNYALTYVVHNRGANEVEICYPSVGSTRCDKALVYNYLENTWTPKDLPNIFYSKAGVRVQTANTDTWDYESTLTWDAENELFWKNQQFSPIGDDLIGAGTQLWALDTGTTANGGALDVYVERSGLLIDGTDDWNMVCDVYPRCEGTDSFTLYVGKQSTIHDTTIMWSAGKTITPGTTRKVNFRVNAPVHAWKIEGAGDWKFYGMDVHYEFAGGRR